MSINQELAIAYAFFLEEAKSKDWDENKLSFGAKIAKSVNLAQQRDPNATPSPKQAEWLIKCYEERNKSTQPSMSVGNYATLIRLLYAGKKIGEEDSMRLLDVLKERKYVSVRMLHEAMEKKKGSDEEQYGLMQ